MTYHKGHWCFWFFAVFITKLHLLFTLLLDIATFYFTKCLNCPILIRYLHTPSCCWFHTSFCLASSANTTESKCNSYNIKVKHITSIWNFTSHLVVKSAVFPLQNFLNRSSRLLGNSSIISIVFTLTDSKLQPMYEYTLPFCWGRWQATN